MSNTIKIKTRYDMLDISKFVLSIMIVAVHTNLFPKILYPWLRVAVPMFFIISSFLLFEKLKITDESDRKQVIKAYVIRNLKLYLFYFVLLLPITIVRRRELFYDGAIIGLLKFIRNIFFSSTFIASWFIPANLLGMLITLFLSKKINNKKMFLAYLIPYILCCLISSYSYLFQKDIIIKIYSNYTSIFTSPVFSFPVSLIWILLGKLFSDNKKMKFDKFFYIKKIIFLVIFGILLFIECRFSFKMNGIYSKDCYFTLLPFVCILFELILSFKIKCIYSEKLRKISTIIYPLHASIAYVVGGVIKRLLNLNGILIGLFNFIIVLFLCLVICYIIFYLEKKSFFKWLKYSH